TAQLSTIPLLLRVMELSPIADLDMERMLSKMRASMLTRVTSEREKVQGLPFYTALAMHCFTNEYVFSESEEEKQKIELLQEEVKVALEKRGTVSLTRIAVLGAYRPLSGFSWADDLLRLKWSGDFKKIVVAQVGDVRKEQALRSKIPRLTAIEDKVSQAVRNQYEENPYPRWINAGLSDKPRPIRKVLQAINIHHNLDAQQFSDKPDVLVAGCGTGQHALGTASRFLNCNVLAVDLSLSSLSYAMRKTQELGVTNIEYMQGDILKLNQLERQFDIIESAGVLHHMDDPLAGWNVLVDRLRSGGLMKVGLYSDTARQHIVKARKYIAKKKYTTSPDNIRKFREEVINMNPNSDSEITQVVGSPDFYSLSACRDLLFHVQEHRFTLPQIEAALNDLDLRFLGFELRRSWIRRSFSEFYPEKDALTSLSLWHQFELKNPRTFRGMYQFWVQKA
ncbi:MAG: class I SAM-dependent methyltransferase, partial [Rhodospirillales bacterium]|nr:class I SAM-dependent methyltransferase [Rhodospirillales bacterium]